MRIEAAQVRGMLYSDRHDEDSAARRHIKQLGLCHEAMKDKEYLKTMVLCNQNREETYIGERLAEYEAKGVIEGLMRAARGHIAGMQGTIRGMLTNEQRFAMEKSLSRANSRLLNDIFKAKRVAALSCGNCGKTRIEGSGRTATENVGVKLKRCSRCEQYAYCSKECQTMHWKQGGHREVCRDVGDFQVKDIIIMVGLANRDDLNGSVGEVKNIVKKDDGTVRFAVMMLENMETKILAKAENMRMLIAAEER
ncbi:hypothetical protein HDU76_002638 [Blyttiomyces sp. JEL0837]|nr:hypothetical protein HDU76_002638 [Blyttiomyces sp. JEL0837]